MNEQWNKLGTSLDMSEGLRVYRQSSIPEAESEGLAGRFTTVGNAQDARTR